MMTINEETKGFWEAKQVVFCEGCDCYHVEGQHGEWIDRKDPRHSEYPNGAEDEFIPRAGEP